MLEPEFSTRRPQRNLAGLFSVSGSLVHDKTKFDDRNCSLSSPVHDLLSSPLLLLLLASFYRLVLECVLGIDSEDVRRKAWAGEIP